MVTLTRMRKPFGTLSSEELSSLSLKVTAKTLVSTVRVVQSTRTRRSVTYLPDFHPLLRRESWMPHRRDLNYPTIRKRSIATMPHHSGHDLEPPSLWRSSRERDSEQRGVVPGMVAAAQYYGQPDYRHEKSSLRSFDCPRNSGIVDPHHISDWNVQFHWNLWYVVFFLFLIWIIPARKLMSTKS